MTKFRSEEFEAGWRAYCEGRTSRHNPYPYPSKLWKYDEWYQGWYEALMKDQRQQEERDFSVRPDNDA